MTEFLVQIEFTVPPEIDQNTLQRLREHEARRATELATAGAVRRLWRVPGRWANWGLWRADSESDLHRLLASLPLFPLMSITIHPTAPHPSDPDGSSGASAASRRRLPAKDVPMPVSVTLPDLGDSVTEGTISRWLKTEGDRIEVQEPLLEVSTDKVDTEIPAPAAGILTKIIAQEGDTLAIGTELAMIDDAPDTTTAVTAVPVPAAAAAPDHDQVKATDKNTTPYVTPLVRRMAVELGVDLHQVVGSGIGDRIRKSDVLAFAEKNKTQPRLPAPVSPNTYLSPLIKLKTEQHALEVDTLTGTGHNGRIRLSDLPGTATSASGAAQRTDRTEKLTRLRSVIATRMVESLHTSAQLTTVIEVDVTEIGALRAKYGTNFVNRTGVKLSYTPFFVRAAVDALTKFPAFNASLDQDAKTVTYHADLHLSMATDTDRGLLAPVIRNAGTLDLAGVAQATADLAHRARANTLTADELTGGTFTLTNTGSRGALFDTPIINQPQVAILGTGAVVDRPMVVKNAAGDKSVEIRSMVYLALTYDHRLIDGADAARFLTAIKANLEGAEFASELI
ncbi:muconolactone Delta-isomerase family protein [Rhodococcus sp. WB1]|uniref:muconolactone Delta-isomerase family protein n=1 Tax=Rhodococcus sp. WB1 TaxID=1033922 RepID=UPI0009FFEC11|nr:muconolactone Delta-isomerase family protein [Rhodococcus sp. WB1]